MALSDTVDLLGKAADHVERLSVASRGVKPITLVTSPDSAGGDGGGGGAYGSTNITYGQGNNGNFNPLTSSQGGGGGGSVGGGAASATKTFSSLKDRAGTPAFDAKGFYMGGLWGTDGVTLVIYLGSFPVYQSGSNRLIEVRDAENKVIWKASFASDYKSVSAASSGGSGSGAGASATSGGSFGSFRPPTPPSGPITFVQPPGAGPTFVPPGTPIPPNGGGGVFVPPTTLPVTAVTDAVLDGNDFLSKILKTLEQNGRDQKATSTLVLRGLKIA